MKGLSKKNNIYMGVQVKTKSDPKSDRTIFDKKKLFYDV